MSSIKRVVAVLLFSSVAIVGLLMYRNRTMAPRDVQQRSTTNAASEFRVAQENQREVSRPLYGKASLTAEEKRILHKPFDNCFRYWCGSNIYLVGMICMKHRLSREEIMELIKESPVEPLEDVYLSYRTGIGQLITFTFGQDGNLQKAVTVGSKYQFPPLETVTHETAIEPLPEFFTRPR